MAQRRVELSYQNHIMDSYKIAGGRAKKWASEWQKGVPDLIASLHGVGVHLVEVKHVPTFDRTKTIKNPLQPKQKQECRDYIEAGGLVMGFLVCGPSVIKSELFVFNPCADLLDGASMPSVPYRLKAKYDLRPAIRTHMFHMGLRDDDSPETD